MSMLIFRPLLTFDICDPKMASPRIWRCLKSFLDVVLFTRSLSRVMGYETQGMLYAYFFLVALTLKSISPPLSLMHAQVSSLSKSFSALMLNSH